jgi:hypothetical protein
MTTSWSGNWNGCSLRGKDGMMWIRMSLIREGEAVGAGIRLERLDWPEKGGGEYPPTERMAPD